ncbi:DUF2807 domain-containing protein [Massilia arenosa]|uniref:DUF2807 domain-containing protein n=1 Tax=Zemynaea arenosa TaxID=2561931 RepID=A0A4Y9S9F4_9BURK|nr:DUF2807 domain-containing protein [Massilia arenosa]TFW17151.1 DUF2807 domain-containing protein [Massilia arenosa]
MKALQITALGVAFAALHFAHAAGPSSNQTTAVDGNVDKVHLGGVVELHVRQGAKPGLVLSGDPELVAKTRVRQSGGTLDIDTDRVHNINLHDRKVVADLTVTSLREFVSDGVGSAELTGFKGDSIRVVLDGVGSVRLQSDYRNADLRLGGVGHLRYDSPRTENIDVALRGAGAVELTGEAKTLRARLGGVGGLDAKDLHADSVDIDLSGLGGANVYARTAASVRLSGMGSAKIYGHPQQRSESKSGMGSITWY